MDYWREFFRRADVNIFEIIKGAITLAASDWPKEFEVRRDSIAEILFSCRLIKCSGCGKQELAVPVDNQHHQHHDQNNGSDGNKDDDMFKYNSELAGGNGNSSKESSKVINSSRNDDDDIDIDIDGDDDDHHGNCVELNGSNLQVSNCSYGVAEALTDEIEQEGETLGEVMRIKEIIDNSTDESASVLCDSLRKLQFMAISVETLKETEIGKSVNALRKHVSKDVCQMAKSLIEMWKHMVHQWVNATAKITASENTPQSINPSVVDEEEGLPSPPLDDLAFLNPHSMSLELSEKFFDGMDDYGNPQKSDKCNTGKSPVEKQKVTDPQEIDKCNTRKSPVDKQKVTKLKQQKQQKQLNRQTNVPKATMVPKPTIVRKPTMVPKPCKPPVNPTSGRRVNPDMNQKLQNREKTSLPERPAAQLHKPMSSSDGEAVQDKLEATKRKLQERYQQAENDYFNSFGIVFVTTKRQRTVQFMEPQDLPKPPPARPGTRTMVADTGPTRVISHVGSIENARY